MKKNVTRFMAVAMATILTFTGIGFTKDNSIFAQSKQMTSGVGSSDATGVRVPTLAYDDQSITIVWDKPEKYDNVADYNVYINGKLSGTARESFKQNADWAAAYMESFYAGYEAKAIDMVNVDIHSYKAINLKPSTEYTFQVKAVDSAGKEIGSSNTIKQSTTAKPKEFNIVDFGAKTSVGYTSYDDTINAFIEANTKAIQAAIDACSTGGKVIIPKGTFVSGSIYLKSNMTLEIQDEAILWASPNVDHYDQNYLLYPYSTDTRSWALINTYSADENKLLENIRITGNGTVYGNGWKYGAAGTIDGDGTVPFYQTPNALDPTNSKYKLERWVAGSNSKVGTFGILAKDATQKGVDKGLTIGEAYAKRPNLITLRGVNGIYMEGITVKNPANHSLALLDSENVVSNNLKYITYDCNNGDGIEIGNTTNAFVFNNFFDTGDDSINFATGLGNGVKDTEQKPSSEIWTFNNFIRNGHGGAIAAGSHTGAGICDMLVEDNVINLNEMPFRFKSAPVNGGGVFNVTIRDIAVANCKQLFTMSTSYSDANQAVTVEPADKPAEFYNISARNITADMISKNTFELKADVSATYKPWHTHHDLYFQDIVCTNINNKDSDSEVLMGCEDVEFNNVILKWGSAVASPIPWNSITYSKNIKFTGTTTTSAKTTNAMSAPLWQPTDALTATTVTVDNTTYTSASVDLNWPAATDDSAVSSYSIDTFIGDQIDGIKTTTKTISGLSTGTDYEFVVYANDATGNKTAGPDLKITSAGTKDVTPIVAPASADVTFSGMGYTWGIGSFASARLNDQRVRGYKAYVNDILTDTFYNYEINNATTSATMKQVIRRMTAGADNAVKIVAFTDAGIEHNYNVTTVKTTENYDFKAPVWSTDAKLNVTVSGKDVVLTWPKATDDSGISGYRLYADGKAILGTEGKEFNHVNGNYTTKNNTYTISGLDLEKEHTFKVEAGDNWWKAVNGSGPYHWTESGPSAKYVKAEPPTETPTVKPTEAPTVKPTEAPTVKPTEAPTVKPTETPTETPTVKPTESPTKPTDSTKPTAPAVNVEGKDVIVEVAAGTVIRNADGSLSSGTVYVNASKDGEKAEAGKKAIIKAMEQKGMVIDKNASVQYMDIALNDASGNMLTFDGKLRITLAYPNGSAKDGYSFKVLHLKKDGSIEMLDPVVTDKGLQIDVGELSPFAIEYKSADSSDSLVETSPTTGDTSPILPIAVALLLSASVGILVYKKGSQKKHKIN